MTVQEVLAQVEIKDGNVISKSTGTVYAPADFVNQISSKLKWTAKQKRELESYFISYLRSQTEQSKYIEELIAKYDFKFSDGIYILKGEVMSLDEIYRLLWKEEKLLPADTDVMIENIEKISEPMPLQENIYKSILAKTEGKPFRESQYLKSLDKLYPDIEWRRILYNILVPKTTPLFHIFYDDGVGGTGKSTFLEVVTKIVGENFTSNVLLDQFGNRFIFANMLGKYVNIGDDNGKNDELQNVGTLKSIITGGRITIDRKNISPIEVRIFAKQLFATNILPYIDFTDGGVMRRLNIIPMNKVIPKDMPMCVIDEEEIAAIINEVYLSKDLEYGNNELAITTSPLYRFYNTEKTKTYGNYKDFCDNFGFRKMNIINFEVKSKFIQSFIERKTGIPKELTPIDGELKF